MFIAVRTTGIYCRPGCSGRPKPENTVRMPSRRAAGSAGFRPCKRCRPELGEELRFAVVRSRFGRLLVAMGDRGVRSVVLADSAAEAERELREQFPASYVHADRSGQVRATAERIAEGSHDVELDLRGSAFQLEVWRKLLEIPAGQTWTYSQLAAAIGRPAAVRAVGSACGSNRLAVLVPCHRVVGTGGALTGYRWGVERKRALLDAESPAD